MTVLPPSATTLTLLWNLSVLPDGSNTTLTLPLAPGETGSMLLNEVVVTALGLSRESKSLSYNVQEVVGGEN